jgi:hypothetical protein
VAEWPNASDCKSVKPSVRIRLPTPNINKSMKILVTGNPNYGIASALASVLGEEHVVDFVSPKHNGVDLNKREDFRKIVDDSLNYDVVINNVRLDNYAQVMLFDSIFRKWYVNKKQGQIINIGSVADQTREKTWVYGSEKAALRQASASGSFASIFKSTGIKVTYLAFGWVSTPAIEISEPNVKKHSPEEIAKLIKWVLDYPFDTNIIELRMEPIQ